MAVDSAAVWHALENTNLVSVQFSSVQLFVLEYINTLLGCFAGIVKFCCLRPGRSRSWETLAKTCIFNSPNSGLDTISLALFGDTFTFL